LRFPIELKVTLSDGVDEALARLGLDQPGDQRRIGFLEDLRDPAHPLPLLEAGIVLRVREGDDDDSTVKFRPCVPSQVRDADQDDDDVAIEEDWAGPRRTLAASCKARLAAGRIAAVRAGDDPLRRLFTDEQRRYLAYGAHDVAVDLDDDLDGLTLLPPIDARRWKDVAVGDPDHPAVAERWTVGDLDFLELSLRIDTDETAKDAERAGRALAEALTGLGLALPAGAQETKTRTVLEFLARQ
jgi:hypothetical protein